MFKYTNGIDVIPNDYMEDGNGIKIGNKLYMSTNDYNALKERLEMEKTRWGRFRLWLRRMKKKLRDDKRTRNS